MKFVIILAALISAAAAQSCNGAAAEADAAASRCSSNTSVVRCSDGTYCQCIAALFNLCSVPSHTSSWRPGLNVVNNCNLIAKYTAIATFDNGVYNWQGDRGHAGIFISCSNGGINMIDQWCGAPMAHRYYPRDGWSGDPNFVFRTSAKNYYVVK